MNKLLTLLAVWILSSGLQVHGQGVSPILIANGVARNGCSSIGDPVVNNCIADIPKQIARSVNAEGIVDWITPETCWGWIGTNGTPYNEALIPPPNTQVNCNPPYDRCYSHYCPQKYCDVIKSFVDMKASIILRAANTWGKAGYMQPGSTYYTSLRQFVIDVNAAYDCAGLRRPVIQGGIFEFIDDGVDGVRIPADVINAFRTESGFEAGYYLDGSGNPKNLNFKKSRMLAGSSWTDCPKIIRIETKMWFYYMAKVFIDFGYKSIHMGQMNGWADGDGSFAHTTVILRKMRQYAQSKGTFVLLTEENRKAFKFPGTNTFMYDYDSRVLWPREISSPQVGSSVSCSGGPLNYLAGTPCGGEAYKAVIDPCVLTNLGNTGGYSPLYGCYMPYMPYNTYFDFGAGNHPPVGVATSSPWQSVWGWDDTKWFGMKISTSCRSFWMADAIWRNRKFYNGFGFMSAPGLLAIGMPENADKYKVGINPTAGASYLLSDEPVVKSSIIRAWQPNSNVTVTAMKECVNINGLCGFLPPKLLRQNKYTFSVKNPDNSTVYTWHMQYPNGSWLPFTYGEQRVFYPPTTGYYTVYLRQDNLGTYTGTPFITAKTISFKVYMYRHCCGGANSAKGTEVDPTLTEDYEGEIFLEEGQDNMGVYEDYVNSGMAFHLPDDVPDYEDSLEFVAPQKPSRSLVAGAINESREISIYPNPASSILFVKSNYEFEYPVDIKLMDITGRTVEVIKNVRLSSIPTGIPLSSVPPGAYFINITSDVNNVNERFKFIKQ